MDSNRKFTLLLSEKARKEIEKSWLWYEEREAKLGDRFLEEVVRKLDTITQNPLVYTLRHSEYREAVLSVFPFVIIFSINNRKHLIKVHSVFHTSRHPRSKF